jgi:hypothetical protein
MDNNQLASSYATAKCCGFTGSFDEFKEMYDQYYSEIIKELPTGENSVDVAKNPFNLSNYR